MRNSRGMVTIHYFSILVVSCSNRKFQLSKNLVEFSTISNRKKSILQSSSFAKWKFRKISLFQRCKLRGRNEECGYPGLSTPAKNLFIETNLCHHQHFTSADGFPRLVKFWPQKTYLQTHRQQNLSRVKTVWMNNTVINLSIICQKSYSQLVIELKSVY